MTISRMIRDAREAKGLTQIALANLIGYSTDAPISKLETTGRLPSAEKIPRLLHVLELDPVAFKVQVVDDMIARAEARPPATSRRGGDPLAPLAERRRPTATPTDRRKPASG